MLKRLADAIEREADPLRTFRAPRIAGGIGREDHVPWSARDDAMLLLGVYKHGYRAYLEIRDDPELHFSCRARILQVRGHRSACARCRAAVTIIIS